MFEECLYFNSNALARTVTRIWTEAYKPYDLSPPHAFLLRLVLSKPGLLPTELAQELHLSPSTITRFIDSLEKRKFLIRKMTTMDGREVQIFPTNSSKRIHKELDQIGKDLTQHMKNIIGAKDLSQTVINIRKFQALLEID